MIATGNSHDAIISESKSVEQADNQHEQIMQIPVAELHPFEGHPFRVTDDEDMLRMAESMTQYGVISPLLARPDTDGGYEIISGHRRRRAAELAGLETLPVVIREMDDDEAIIAMADTNLQRETILPSERAWAYKMKLDAIKHQGARTDITSGQVGHKLAHGTKSVFTVAEDAGVSKSQVQRYIRLTNLIPELMKAGYPPIDIKFTDRLTYFNAFDEYHIKHNLSAMEGLFAGYINARLDMYLKML